MTPGREMVRRTPPARKAYSSTFMKAMTTKVASRMAICGPAGASWLTNCGTKARKKAMDLGLVAVTR